MENAIRSVVKSRLWLRMIFIIVGAGFAGSILAERLASENAAREYC